MGPLTHGTERGGRVLRVTALLTLVISLFAIPATASAVAPGGFDQLPLPAGCLSSAGVGGCTAIHDQGNPYDMVISPDGKHLYATSNAATLTAFDRNGSDGSLTQKGGLEGCLINGAATATCKSASNMSSPLGMAITPNGRTLYVAAFASNAVLSFDRDPDTGNLTQKPAAGGCMSNTGNGVTCKDARAMAGPYYLAVTADGKNLYVAAYSGSSVTGMSIDGNGVLTQLQDGGGGAGCVQNTPDADGCADGRALLGPFAMNVDPDGETIYPAAYDDHSVSALARDPATGRLAPVPGLTGCVDAEGTDGCTVTPELGEIRDLTGAPGNGQLYVASETTNKILTFDRLASGGLVRKAGDAGCVSNGAAADCRTGRALSMPAGMAASADGDDIYVVSRSSGSGLVELDRDSNGVLTPRADSRGCAALSAPPANCQTVAGMGSSGMYDVKLSPDGRFIYTSNISFNTFGVFRRDSQGPVCTNAAQTVTQGTLTALKIPCSDVDGDPVSLTAPVSPPTIGTLGAVDQGSGTIPYAASQGQCGTTSFTYRGSSSGQTSGTGTFTLSVVGCSGGGGPTSPTLIPSTVGNNWAASRTFTTVITLSARRLPAGARVVVKCKTKSKRLQKRRCPYKSKSFKAPAGKDRVNLAKQFRKKKLPLGTKITITITAPTFIGKVFTYTIRRRAAPRLKLTCLAPGSTTKAAKCS